MKHAFIYALLLFSFLKTFAQQPIIYNNQKNVALSYNYGKITGSSAPVLNNILKTIARRNYQTASFELNFVKEIKILKNNNREIEVRSLIRDFKNRHLPKFRGFKFKKIVLPYAVSYDIEIIDANNKIVKRITAIKKPVRTNRTTWHSNIYMDTLLSNSYTAKIKNIYCHFSNEALRKVNTKIQNIKFYEKSHSEVLHLTKTIEDLNLENPKVEYLEAYQRDFENVRRNYEAVKKADFWQILNLDRPNAHDPSGLKNACSHFLEVYNKRHAILEDLVANQHLLHYENALHFYDNHRLTDARNALNEALKHNPHFPPAHYLLAEIAFNSKNLQIAHEEIQFCLREPKIDLDTKNNAIALLQKIKKHLFRKW